MSYFPSLAFLGGSVGAGEWVVLFMVILIVVGPKNLPAVARKLGRTMEMFRRAADEFKDQLLNMDQETPPAVPPASSSSDASPDAGSYENPYPDTADYPGNEGHVENWAAGETPAPEAAPPAEAPSPPEPGGAKGEGRGESAP
jgi:TatA/E family protein of Tat protein translocase